MEIKSETMLTGYSDGEKAAYLGALAALATSDHEANEEELDHFREIAHAAGISPDQEQNILEAAKDTSGNNLKKCLDTLKGSDLRYGLITDLIALAKADESYSEEEKSNIEKVAQYLNVDKNQFSVLSRMAFDVFSILLMSAECERVFSAAKIFISNKRNRIKDDIIEIYTLLRH